MGNLMRVQYQEAKQASDAARERARTYKSIFDTSQRGTVTVVSARPVRGALERPDESADSAINPGDPATI